MCKALKGYVELLVFKVLLECKDLCVRLVNTANVVRKDTKVPNVLLEIKAIVVNEVNVVRKEKGAFKVILQMF